MDRMQHLETRMDDLVATHDSTKQTMIIGFRDIEKSFDQEHTYNSKNHEELEDDIKDVKLLIKDGTTKRKSIQIEQDAAAEEEE
eukprot:7996681-Heterocapsa_arctica.AAC.1